MYELMHHATKERRALFLRVPKSATTSTSEALGGCGWQLVQNRHVHTSLQHAPEAPFRFATVRSPVAWYEAVYKHLKRNDLIDSLGFRSWLLRWTAIDHGVSIPFLDLLPLETTSKEAALELSRFEGGLWSFTLRYMLGHSWRAASRNDPLEVDAVVNVLGLEDGVQDLCYDYGFPMPHRVPRRNVASAAPFAWDAEMLRWVRQADEVLLDALTSLPRYGLPLD